jgi:hypothetical protein
MNRIREYNGKYEVLITPTQLYDTGFELLMGNWPDSNLVGFSVKQFNTLNDAMCEAYMHPDINWDKLVLFQKDNFHNLKKKIIEIIKRHQLVVDFEAKIMTPIELKDVMFDRVKNMGNKFSLPYYMNDIISFKLINTYSANLQTIYRILSEYVELRIIKKITPVFNGQKAIPLIQVIGKTDNSVTYEITLMTNVVANWMKWISQNPQLDNITKRNTFDEAIEIQSKIDNK